jgi:hypothetical protein
MVAGTSHPRAVSGEGQSEAAAGKREYTMRDIRDELPASYKHPEVWAEMADYQLPTDVTEYALADLGGFAEPVVIDGLKRVVLTGFGVAVLYEGDYEFRPTLRRYENDERH